MDFCFRPVDGETERGCLFSENLQSVSYGVQKHCEDDYIICVAEIGITGVIFSAKIWATVDGVVEPVVDRDVEEARCGDTSLADS